MIKTDEHPKQHHCPRCWTAAALAWIGDAALRLSDRLVPFERY